MIIPCWNFSPSLPKYQDPLVQIKDNQETTILDTLAQSDSTPCNVIVIDSLHKYLLLDTYPNPNVVSGKDGVYMK